MDIAAIVRKLPKWLHTYRYPLLIVLVGVLLLSIPGRKNTQTETAAQTNREQPQQQDMTAQLSQILAQIDGVGKVKLMLSISAGETTLYHSDENISASDGNSTVRKETVIITDSGREQQALITQVIPAKYQGAVVVCQGASDPKVKLAVVEAVSRATGLGADQISVLKMK